MQTKITVIFINSIKSNDVMALGYGELTFRTKAFIYRKAL